MALKKILEYTFDNSMGDCLPTISPTSINMTTEDKVSNTKTTRTISIDETLFPTHIHFTDKTSLLTVDFVKIDSRVTSMMNMFRGCSNLTSVNFSGCDASNVTTMQNMFLNASKITSINLSGLNFTKLTNMQQTFNGCSSLETINFTDFNTSLVKDMYQLFNNCTSLIKLDLSSFDTHSVTNMGYMFFGCSKLTTLNLSNFNTTQVTNMNAMFRECSSLRFLEISSFDTSKVTNMAEMFRACSSLEELDLSNFNVTKVQQVQGMFNECVNLKSINLSSFKTSEVTNMSNMFRNCERLTSLDLSAFETSKVTDFSMMFEACKAITSLDLSNFKLDVASDISGMFQNLSSLTTLDISNFKLSSTPTTSNMFSNTSELSSVGMIYSNSETINIITAELETNGIDLYYIEADESDLIAQTNIVFKKYIFHSIIQLPPHIKLYALPDGTKDELDLKTGVLVKRIEEMDGELVKLETPKTEKLILNHNNSCKYGLELPNGVADSYNVVDSLYTRNVASVFINGSYSWESLELLEKTIKFTGVGDSVGVENLNMKGLGSTYCDNGMFPNINDDSDVEHCYVDEDGDKFYFFINKDKLMSPDLIGWQYWLASNNFTLYYEMNESETYAKPYEELNPNQARWEMLECMRDGEFAHDTNSEDGITLYPTMEYVAPSSNNFNVSLLEPSTEYTIYAKNTTNNQKLNLGGITYNFTNGSKYVSGGNQWVTFNGSDTSEVVIIKGDTTNEYVTYFEGIESVKTPVLTSTGKNLFSGEVSINGQLIFTTGTVNTNYKDFWTTDYFNVEPNKNYSFTMGASSRYCLYDENKDYISGENSQSFNTGNATYVRLCGSNQYATLVYGTEIPSTEYEPYRSNIFSSSEEIILCKVGDVKDELNLLTGDFTQRINEVTFDGYESGWGMTSSYSQGKTMIFKINSVNKSIPSPLSGSLPISEKMISNSDSYSDKEGIIPCQGVDGHEFYIRIERSKLETQDVNGFLNYLRSNPLTLYYQLETPVTRRIQIIHTLNSEEQNHYNIFVGDKTTITLSSETPITPNLVYSLPSKNSFYLASMKTGTRYTLKYPSATGSINIGNLSYNVSGESMLFMTPFEITGDKNAIVFSDEDPQDVILVEGDYNNREIPYFTGMKSIENPVIEVFNKLTTETTQYKSESASTILRSLPSGISDTWDIVTGMFTQLVGYRAYQNGDEDLVDVLTDGKNTVYGLSSPVIRSVPFPVPMVTSFSNIKVFSDNLIPRLQYRALSPNNFPLDLLQSNKTYTLYANVSNIGSYTLGGTYTSNFYGTTTVTLGDVTSKSLIFNGNLGVSNVMLIEGDTTKSTIPYFTGVISVEDIIMYIKGFKGEMNSMILDDDVILDGFTDHRDIIDLTTGILTKKTEQIILTGNENWIKFDNVSIHDDFVLFRLNIPNMDASSKVGLKCDKFNHVFAHNQLHQVEGIYSISTVLNLCVKKSTIGGDNITMLKLWLSRNNVKVVYPLIKSSTVQLKNLWVSMPPMSYHTKTIIIDSSIEGVSLKPIFTATVATTTLEEIVSELETQNEQLEQENISTMLAMTSLYEMMYGTSAATMSLESNTYGMSRSRTIVQETEEEKMIEISPIGKIYVALIKRGLKTINEIPLNLREEVLYALNNN